MSSFNELWQKVMEQERKIKKGKWMSTSADSLTKDPKMKYKAHGKAQPGSLSGARLFFQVLYMWAAMDPQDRELMMMAAHFLYHVEGVMDAFDVTADVLYDETEGYGYPLLIQPVDPGSDGPDPFDLKEIETGES